MTTIAHLALFASSIALGAGLLACGGTADDGEEHVGVDQSALYRVDTADTTPGPGEKCTVKTDSGLTCTGTMGTDNWCNGTIKGTGGRVTCGVACSNHVCKSPSSLTE